MNLSSPKKRRGRPPKVTRENQDTKAELIRSGLEQLTEQGFSSSGIEQILKKVGVPKGSFYHYFANKEAFGKAVIDSYASFFAKRLDSYLLDTSYTPFERLTNYVENAKQAIESFEFKRGCLIGNLGQEITLLPESYRQQLIDIFEVWQQRVATCLTEAQAQGTLSKTANCDLLAEYFWIGWEGAVSRAKLVQNSTPLDNFYYYFISGLPK